LFFLYLTKFSTLESELIDCFCWCFYSVISASLKPTSQWGIFASKSHDSYVAIRVDSQNKKTEISAKNNNPQWDHAFNVQVTAQSIIEFKVYNYNSYKTDLMLGSASCKVFELLQQNGGKLEFFPMSLTLLREQHQPAGKLDVQFNGLRMEHLKPPTNGINAATCKFLLRCALSSMYKNVRAAFNRVFPITFYNAAKHSCLHCNVWRLFFSVLV